MVWNQSVTLSEEFSKMLPHVAPRWKRPVEAWLLALQGSKDGAVESIPMSRVLANFALQLEGARGAERLIVIRQIRRKLGLCTPAMRAAILNQLGIGATEGAAT